MNKPNPDNIPEEQTQQTSVQNAADKRSQKKALRKEKKAY